MCGVQSKGRTEASTADGLGAGGLSFRWELVFSENVFYKSRSLGGLIVTPVRDSADCSTRSAGQISWSRVRVSRFGRNDEAEEMAVQCG